MSVIVYIGAIIILFIMLYFFFFKKNHKMTSSVSDAKNEIQIQPGKLNYNTSSSNTSSTNFCYSIWFYIKDWNYSYGDSKILFTRSQANNGNDACPSVVIDRFTNNLVVNTAVYSGTSSDSGTSIHTCKVDNIPVQKWINLTVSVMNRSLDIYLNGKLTRTCILTGVPKTNSNDSLYITPGGGFSGWTSKMLYWPDACNPQKAWNIYKEGYGGGFLNLFERLKIKVTVLENNIEKNSVTL